jgi:cell division protein FtsB
MPLGTIFTVAKFLKWFVKVREVITASITGAIRIVTTYPKATLLVLVLLVGGAYLSYSSYHWGKRAGLKENAEEIASLRATIDQYALLVEQRNARIKELEENSIKIADMAEEIVQKAAAAIGEISSSYEKLLSSARNNPRIKTEIVYVKVPTQEQPVEVQIREGEVICRRYPDEYQETVNRMVKAANDAISNSRGY